MLYRPYGKLGFDVSAFGMGCMRLPQTEGEDGRPHVDLEESVRMIRHAIDNGVNYLDTSCVYGFGESEIAIGMALRDGYRNKVHIATKVPPRMLKSRDEMKGILEAQLKRLETDFIDVYLIHHLDRSNWQQVRDLRMFEMLEEFRSQGIIGASAFSYHGQLPTFKEVVEAYPWTMAQVQHNLLDVDSEITDEGIDLVGEKGMALVIMEPLRGGGLAQKVPEVQSIYGEFPVKRNPVEWAFRFVYDYPQVSCILSGVSTMDQLKEDIAIFSNACPNVMNEDEKLLMKRVKAVYEQKIKVMCTGCEYCMPCPNGVSIARIFDIYNRAHMFGDIDAARRDYIFTGQRGGNVEKCIECGICETRCPQRLHIIDELKMAQAELA